MKWRQILHYFIFTSIKQLWIDYYIVKTGLRLKGKWGERECGRQTIQYKIVPCFCCIWIFYFITLLYIIFCTINKDINSLFVLFYFCNEQDVVMLNGFGTVVNALGKRVKPYLPQICGTILWRLNNKSAKVRQQAADLISRIAIVMKTCQEVRDILFTSG